MKENISTLPDLVEIAAQIGIDEIYVSHTGYFSTEPNLSSLYVHREESDHYCRCAKERAEKLSIQLSLPPFFSDWHNSDLPSTYTCSWINHTVIILSNGDVIPCCHASSRFNLVMGNIHQNTVTDIWYSPKYMFLRDSLQKGHYPPSCLNCVSNTPFMTVTDTWDIDSFYADDPKDFSEYSFITSINALYEKILKFQQQQILYASANENLFMQSSIMALHLEKKVQPLLENKIFPKISKYFHAQRIQGYLKQHLIDFPLISNDVPEANAPRYINTLLYNQEEDFQGNLPLRIDISLLAGCNIRCIMCNYSHFSTEEMKSLLRIRMEKDVYHSIATQLFPTAQIVFFGIGGEPTLHPDFPLFLEIAKNAGLSVHISSNGLSFNREIIAQAIINNADILILSIDGACKETYEKIRAGAKWERLLSGMRNLQDKRKQHPHAPLKMAINFTLMKCNIHEFPEVVTLAHEYGINKVMAEHLIVTSPELEEQSLFDDKERSDFYIIEAINKARRLGIEMELPDLFNMQNSPKDINSGTIRNIRPTENQVNTPFCKNLGYSIVITPGGVVLPCSHPDAQKVYRFGHLKDCHLQEIWFGRKYQELRHSQNNQLPFPCSNCSISGRSDGQTPFQTEEQPTSRHGRPELTSPYPKPFLRNKILFIARLLSENEIIETHSNHIKHFYSHIMKHQTNLKKILQKSIKPLSATIDWLQKPPSYMTEGTHFSFSVTILNSGNTEWNHGSSEELQSVMVGGRLYSSTQMFYLEGWGEIPVSLKPCEHTAVLVNSNICSIPADSYILKIDAVKLGVGFFEDFGSESLQMPLHIIERDASEILWQTASQRCVNLWTPTQGTRRWDEQTYPLFISKANKATVHDYHNRKYLDYIMGWGTATLGYNHPSIQQAVINQLKSGITFSLPHSLQIHVAEQLSQIFPCGERILFGKNGSDVLEAAVRIARATTNKEHVLHCGFHGFHDWSVAAIENVKGIPASQRALIHSFPYGNLEALRLLLNKFSGSIAAIVVEPASLDYPPENYLETIREWSKTEGIILIFDEIMSAFRLANGGAQEKYKVIPDMAAVGKGMANGFPLAALAGKEKIMQAAFSIGYGPTFQGEAISLAAANAAIKLYQNEPVCEHINSLGNLLRSGIHHLAMTHNISLHTEGIDPRLVLQFHRMDTNSPQDTRTYFIQELLHHGILFGGTFMPSYAHTVEDINCTLECIDKIFNQMASLIDIGKLKENIHIPSHVLYLGEKKE